MPRKINSIILDTIEFYINRFKENAPFDRTRKAVVTKVNGNLYDIIMNGISYSEVPFLLGGTLNISDIVWVRIPENNMNNMFIDRKAK